MRTGTMEVTVAGAKDLKNTELFGRVDPYVVIQYKDQEQKSTTGSATAKHKSFKSRFKCCHFLQGQGVRRPVWNEKFKFRVDYPAAGAENQQPKLLLKIMDHDNFTNDDILGQTTIYLKEVFELGLENGKAEIPIQKYRVVSSDKTYHGEIRVGITFTLNDETVKKS